MVGVGHRDEPNVVHEVPGKPDVARATTSSRHRELGDQ